MKDTTEAYNEGILDDVIWIRREYKIVDEMKKIILLLCNYICYYCINTHMCP